MWMVNDFPAYENVFGYTTKGKVAYPVCGVDTCSKLLKCSRKFAYIGHRRFIVPNHSFRMIKNWFDGNHETRGRPKLLYGTKVLNVIKDIENDQGKGGKKRKKRNAEYNLPWKKSIFFNLLYWDVSDF